MIEFYYVATLQDIVSPVWTLSIAGGGAIAEGVDAIKQCFLLIIKTTPGSDPLRPTFGCGIVQYVDTPLNVAIPNMKKAILDAVARWETRVTITKITNTLGDTGQVIFNIGYALQDGTLTDNLAVSVSAGGVSTGVAAQRIVLKAEIPTSGTGLQYQIAGQIDGAEILPVPPSTGFATMAALFSWVQTNWLNYGQWYMTGNNILGYLNPGYMSGSLSLSLLSVRQVSAVIPPGTVFMVSVSVDGTTYTSSNINTPGDALAYVQNDLVLSQLGTWLVANMDGDFTDDLSDDFYTYSQILQLLTELQDDIQIAITPATGF